MNPTHPLETLLREAVQRRDPNHALAAIPYASFLNVSVRLQGEACLVRMGFTPAHIGNPDIPALHGGTVGALLECTSLTEMMWQRAMSPDTEEEARYTLPRIVNLSVDYMRSGKPEDTYSVAQVTRMGRRMASLHVEAWQSERNKPIATGVVHLQLS